VVTKFRLGLPEGVTLSGSLEFPYAAIAVSPDGSRFVVGVPAVSAESARLMMRSLDSVELQPISGSNARRNGLDSLFVIGSTGGQEPSLLPPPTRRPAIDDWCSSVSLLTGRARCLASESFLLIESGDASNA